MKNFTLITALSLCSFSWISVSGSESQTVEAQVGEEVTLLSTNMSKYDSVTFWVKLVNGTKASCITVKITSDNAVVYCDGFSKEKYEMTSNISTVFLKIKHLELSDSGLYFCGFYESGRPNFSVIHLHVKEGSDEPHDDADSKCKKESDGTAELMIVVLGGLTVVLVMVIIGLVVKNRKLQT
uniref:Immunoglobulin domain-containing protein n=1 Tax=Dicentrarchus labrax TaxID=13489 RepID=A0A8C4F5Y0_DICLA